MSKVAALDELRPHPAAEIFPLMDGAEFDALVADIREHGQREPAVVLNGTILDGRNRVRACRTIGIEPRLIEWPGGSAPEVFVASMNLHRRHLSQSQRAMIAARLTTLKLGHVASQRDGVEISTPSFSAAQAGQLLNVDRCTVQHAKAVIRAGTSEEIKAVESGNAAVCTVAKRVRERAAPGHSGNPAA